MNNPLPEQLRINTQHDTYGRAREDFYFVHNDTLQKIDFDKFWSLWRNHRDQYSEGQQRGNWQIWTLKS